jgi:hypothetical protein
MRQLSSVSDATTQGILTWGFEVIKHLVVLNGAGLTAIVTIAQISSLPTVSHALALRGSHVFVAGLVIALMSMLTIYATGLLFVRKFTATVLMVSVSTAPLSKLRLTRTFKILIGINWTLAAISIVLFIRGATFIAAIT